MDLGPGRRAAPPRFVLRGVSEKNRPGKRTAREKLAAEREKQKSRDKRRRALIVGASVVCVLGLAAVIGVVAANAGKDDGSSDGDKISAAFRSYQEKFQPFMQQVMRDLDEGCDPYRMVPTSAIGIGILNLIIGLVSFLKLHVLVSSLLREKVDDWQLPAYKELDAKDE